MMKRGMLMTVGVGGHDPESLISCLEKSVRNARPDVLSLVYSSASKLNADRLREKLGSECECTGCEVSDEDNVDKCFMEIASEIQRMTGQGGCNRGSFQVDFTSGTKAMSAAAVLAAVACSVQELRYIAGERKQGTVQRGLEEFRTIFPTRYLAHYQLKAAMDNLRALRFDAAREALDNAAEGAMTPENQILKSELAFLIRGYQAWDLFQHQDALASFRECNWKVAVLSEFYFPKEILSRLNDIHVALNPSKGKEGCAGRPKYSESTLVDLFNNARRRMREGKYDDACARLYRVTEMIAQYVLQRKYQIDAGHVRWGQVPKESRGKYRFSEQNGKERIAKLSLQEDYELLRDLGDTCGGFVKRTDVADVLRKRNQSILAHGVIPVEPETCKEFHGHVEGFLQEIVPDFPQQCRDLQFPWLVSGAPNGND